MEHKLPEELKFPLRIWEIHCPAGTREVLEFLRSVFPKEVCIPQDETSLLLFRRYVPDDPMDSDVRPLEVRDDLVAQIYQDVTIYVSGSVMRQEDLTSALCAIEDLNRLADQQHSREKVFEFDKLLLPSLFYHLGQGTLDSYQRALEQTGPLSMDQDLMDTAIEFFHHDLNVTETASRLFIHRNTLLYRLGRIRALTGYDIRRFPEAVSFYVLYLKKSFQR